MRRLVGAVSLPFCVTVTERPAIVTVAVRDAVVVFAGTTIVAVPLPEPLPVSVIHVGAPDDDQAHPPCVVTVSVVVPPVDATVTVSDETV